MLRVADLMTEPVQTIASSATVAEAIERMQRTQLRALIVERRQEDMPYGMITEQDIVFKVFAREHDPTRVYVQDVMRQPCVGISPTLSLKEAALILAEAGLQRAPVVSDSQLLGIISVTDILMKGIQPPKENEPKASLFSAML